jgi:flagellar biosynthesis/type III secretory pathway protein FliH
MIYKKFELQDFNKRHAQQCLTLDEDSYSQVTELQEGPLDHEILDIKKTTQEAYDEGFASCQKTLQPIIDEFKAKESLHDLLKLKLLEITSFNIEKDYKEQVAKLVVAIIDQVVRKLFLSFPVNFESIFQDRVMDMISKYHKNGSVTIAAHPSRINFVKEFLGTGKSSKKNKNDENYNIISDDSLGNDDCVLEWENNRFEFQVSAVMKEVSDILEQFKTIQV